MNKAQRESLTKTLSSHVTAIAADLRAQMLSEGAVRTRAKELHIDEKVGDDFDVWTDLLSRRAAVLWVLKSVYVRVLEDRGLLRPGRLLDPEAQHLFETLAPNLGETAFLSWVFRDLASHRGGLPELFASQPAEVAVPADALSRALIALWREKDADSGELSWSFAAEEFAGELMGDLYQELDPVVKDRYALCQTPDFVRDFMLGQTLTPAIAELGADKVRVLDPACGSGHFLLDALRRIAEATAQQHPDRSRRAIVEHALDRVVGVDINDYACALARARMVMTAAELAGVESLAEASAFHPHVYWADGLDQVESDEQRHVQLTLLEANAEMPPRAVLSRPVIRSVLRPLLEKQFNVIVANPPYILERDDSRRSYHREKVGRRRRYVTASGKYSLAAVFTERSIQLATESAWVGLIIGNNFMKREFGKPLVKQVLAAVDLRLVVDTSQLQIGDHGTSTLILVLRNRPAGTDMVRAVMGKRGDVDARQDPGRSKVWRSIVEGYSKPGFENEFVSVADFSRAIFAAHPWSLGGGGASELRTKLESTGLSSLDEVVDEVGVVAVTLQDDVYIPGVSTLQRHRVPVDRIRPMILGDEIRDWAPLSGVGALFPYEPTEFRPELGSLGLAYLWPWRTCLRASLLFSQTKEERGLKWWEYGMLTTPKLSTSSSITFADMATHNHFVFDRGGKVFNRHAPVIKLPAGATEDEHLALLGLLNSSTACFWMKQVFHCRGTQGVNEGTKAELWEQFYDFDSTKLKLFPIPVEHEAVLPWARELDRLARLRASRSVGWVLSGDGWKQAADLRVLLEERRKLDDADFGQMVALQEELDWECYRLYGVDPDVKTHVPRELEPILPNWRPVELNLAARDRETHAAIERGDETPEIPTTWFERHRWEPLADVPPNAPKTIRDLVAERRSRIDANPELTLIEQVTYKRRWYRPDHDAEEQAALAMWLADRIERAVAERDGRPCTLAQLTTALEDESRVHAIAEVLTGRKDYRLTERIAAVVVSEAVPNHPFHAYKATGLDKRNAWERTWEEQRKEDAGLPANPEVPPKYGQSDFFKPEYFRLRGKLDVPKERFIAFTEVPGRGAGEVLYGWAGWTPKERVKALLEMDAECEDKGIEIADRIAMLDSAWRLIPDVARDDAKTGKDFRDELALMVGADGPSKVMLDAWKQKFPPPSKARGRVKAKVVAVVDDEDDDA